MANRYWVGGTGNWDASSTIHWSATSNGAGGQSVPTTSDDVYLDENSGGGVITVTATANARNLYMGAFTGTLDTNSQTINVIYYFNLTGTGTRTLTINGSTINVGDKWDATITTNLTFNYSSSTINMTGEAAPYFFGGGLTYNNVSFTSAREPLIQDSNTFANLTITGYAGTSYCWFNSSQTITGTLTINGNSSTNRYLVSSFYVGSAKTLTAANTSFSNIDFADIVGAGNGNWDLTGTTGTPKNLGNCSGITFAQNITEFLGTKTIGTSTSSNNKASKSYAFLWPTDSVGGTLTKIKICTYSTSGTSHIKLAVYENDNSTNLPTNLIASSGELLVSRTTLPTQDSEWLSADINGNLSPNTRYWLVFNPDNNDVYIPYFNYSVFPACQKHGYKIQTYADFPTNPYPTGVLTSYNYSTSFYAIYIESINVNDQITLTENVIISIEDGQVFNINVNDSITIAEDITKDNAQLGNILVLDNLTITELTTPEKTEILILNININDSLTITEDIFILNTYYKIDINDLVSITENVVNQNTQLGGINAIDIINITEINSQQNLSLGAISVFDLVTLTGNISITAISNILTINTLENISITEDINPNKIFNLVKSGLIWGPLIYEP